MKQQKIITIIALCAGIILSTFSGSALAITGNSQTDSTPYTCIVVLFSDAARTQPISYGTGILISPTIVVTAGHCVIGGAAVSVCFDQHPTVTITQTGMTYSTSEPIYDGIAQVYPPYVASIIAGAKPSQALQASDVAIIQLDEPVKEVAVYPNLPTAGLADTLKAGTSLQVIGYGVQEQIQPKNTWVGSFSRNNAAVNLLSGSFQGSDKYIKCSANQAQGKGGIAYGDSGGPTIYTGNGQSILLAVNAYVNNGNCAGVTYHTRIDNPMVLSWISGYLID
jgi:secreted trypsin-like serine protease